MTTIAAAVAPETVASLTATVAQQAKATSQSREIMGDILALFMQRQGKSNTFKITAQERAALQEKAPYTLQVRATADGGIQLRSVPNNG